MAKQTLILAKSITEANAYARKIGLPRFTYRPVRNAGSIRGIRNAEVHILPSFLGRLDRHAILGALRWAKLEVFYVDYRDGKILDGTEGDARFEVNPDGTAQELAGIERFDDYAFPQRYLLGINQPGPSAPGGVLLEPEGWEPPETLTAHEVLALAADPDRPAAEVLEEQGAQTGETEPSEDPASAEEKPRRRRRTRCADCGNLHYREEPCDDQKSDEPEPTPAPAPVDFVF